MNMNSKGDDAHSLSLSKNGTHPVLRSAWFDNKRAEFVGDPVGCNLLADAVIALKQSPIPAEPAKTSDPERYPQDQCPTAKFDENYSLLSQVLSFPCRKVRFRMTGKEVARDGSRIEVAITLWDYRLVPRHSADSLRRI